MGFLKDFKIILKPIFVGANLFVFTSFLFITSYIYLEYQEYLSAYQNTQQLELKAIQQKTEAILEKLKELAQLTSTRIAHTHGDIKLIQNVLSSASRLYSPQELPKIQNFSYYKTSPPQLLITRFGSSPGESKQPPLPASQKESTVTFHNDDLLSKSPVFYEHSNREGILDTGFALRF